MARKAESRRWRPAIWEGRSSGKRWWELAENRAMVSGEGKCVKLRTVLLCYPSVSVSV